MKKHAIYILFIVAQICMSFAMDATISVIADPTAVRIGDRIGLTLAVDYPESARVGFLGRPDSMLGEFNVLSISLDSTQHCGDTVHKQLRYELTYFGISDNFIPPLGIVVINPDTTADTLLTQPIRVSFISALGVQELDSAALDSLDIKDVKSPREVSFNYKKFALNSFLGVLIVGVILGYLWYRNRRKKGLGIFEFIAPVKPPWELALLKLDSLAESDMLKSGEFKEYFDRLTDILREYIERRFYVAALELSTTETMENLHDAELGIDAVLAAWFIDNTGELLKRADLVKFAKFVPDIPTGLQDWESVKELIIATTPKPEPPEMEATSSENRKPEMDNRETRVS